MQDFKIGDKVKFKSSDENYRKDFYPNQTEFVIKKIDSSPPFPVIYFTDNTDGREAGCVPSHLELIKEPENMFKMGNKNKVSAKRFLNYLEVKVDWGLCAFTFDKAGKADKAYEFLRKQKPFEDEKNYPVEFAIRKSQKKSTERYQLDTMYRNQLTKSSHNSEKYAAGRLRRWWAYNLAVAMSQGKK